MGAFGKMPESAPRADLDIASHYLNRRHLARICSLFVLKKEDTSNNINSLLPNHPLPPSWPGLSWLVPAIHAAMPPKRRVSDARVCASTNLTIKAQLREGPWGGD
jgi:hypothetical protein